MLLDVIKCKTLALTTAIFLTKAIKPCQKNVGYLFVLERKMAAHQIHCGRTSTTGSELLLARPAAATRAPPDLSSSSLHPGSSSRDLEELLLLLLPEEGSSSLDLEELLLPVLEEPLGEEEG